jgi:hypothetical protein
MRAFPVGVFPGLTRFIQNPQISSVHGLLRESRSQRRKMEDELSELGMDLRWQRCWAREAELGRAGGAWQVEEAEDEELHGER